MNRREVIARLCELVSTVGSQRFDSDKVHDCFCHAALSHDEPHIDPEIVEFIVNAVNDKLIDWRVGV